MQPLRVYLILMLLACAAACAPADTASMPTLVQLPTLEPTLRPSATFTPSITPTATATGTATSTATVTYTATTTVTNIPSATSTVTNTARPSASPTSTLTYTPTATATPTITPSPIATATSSSPSISSFQSNVTTAPAGGQVELRWVANADIVTLETLNPQGQVLSTATVPAIGTTTAIVPIGGTQAIYRLTAQRGTFTQQLSLTIAIQPVCTTPWFFTTTPNNAIGCPGTTQANYTGAFQTFERGFFFRVVLGSLDRVCGIQNDLQLYTCYPYAAFSGSPVTTPAPNTQPPYADFASPYYSQLAIGGTWSGVIGWGTSPGTSTAIVGQLGQNNKWLIQLPLGIYAFDNGFTSGTLQKVQ